MMTALWTYFSIFLISKTDYPKPVKLLGPISNQLKAKWNYIMMKMLRIEILNLEWRYLLFCIPGKPLQARYYGPYTVDKKLSDVNYIVNTPGRRKQKQLCHINML